MRTDLLALSSSLLLINSKAADPTAQSDFLAFVDFNARFGKSYASAETHNERFQVFKDNLRMIEAHNAKSDLGFKMGVNAYTDLTME